MVYFDMVSQESDMHRQAWQRVPLAGVAEKPPITKSLASSSDCVDDTRIVMETPLTAREFAHCTAVVIERDRRRGEKS
jgi:hypothetical protein